MIEAYSEFVHGLGMHIYTIPTIIVGALIVINGLGHWKNDKKREKEAEDEIKSEK